MQEGRLFFLLFAVFAVIGSSNAYSARRNVRDYGAAGDGVTDDTATIIKALTDGRGDNPNGPYGSTTYSESTKTPALIYFPAGTYKVSAPLPLIYNTQVVGDPDNLPVIKYVYNGTQTQRVFEVAGQWYTGANQNNFYRMIRNFAVDMTQCSICVGVHWQVAQATSVTNVYFKSAIGSKSQGMWMENGSGGFFSDCTFEGGTYGIWVGNQQFTSRNITIRNVSVAGIYLNWDWVWTFTNLQISNAPVGIDIAGGTGSAVVLDSHFVNVPIAVRTVFSTASGASIVDSLLLDNVRYDSTQSGVIVMDSGYAVLNSTGSSTTVQSWAQGYIWNNGATSKGTIDLSSRVPARSALLAPGGNFFQKARPSFPGTNVDVTTLGVTPGTDVTVKLQAALNNYANKSVLFFPNGIYHISSTVVIPPGTRMYGEAWSILIADGAAFNDATKPTPMLQVGTAGQQGVAQLADFMISTNGPQPGAVLIEWNLRDPVNAPGSNGMWDTHYRIGGGVGTNMGPTNCPKGDGTGALGSQCTGAWALLHITKTASLYIENVWGWTADHDIDQHTQINIYNTRGLLCESQGPVWMYGSAMEHNVLYQYNLNGASNIFMGAIQTETPYYQPSILTPFTRSVASDPTYCVSGPACNMAYGLVINNSTNVWVYGAGLYSFFSSWNQTCLNTLPAPTCQQNMVQIQRSSRVSIYALNTYGSIYGLSDGQPYSVASSNMNKFCAGAIVNTNFF